MSVSSLWILTRKVLPVGRWPWNRQNGGLVNELIGGKDRASGFDVVLQRPTIALVSNIDTARKAIARPARLRGRLALVSESLDYDALFAKSLQNRPVSWVYYFTSEGGRTEWCYS
jgi:adenylate cyclase